jgi:transcriptional regulator with XRE-family HTH domain
MYYSFVYICCYILNIIKIIVVTKQELGNKIKERRKVMSIPQSQLANYTGLSVVTLSQIESGKANPSFDTLNEIFHFLNLEILVVVKKPINEVTGNI